MALHEGKEPVDVDLLDSLASGHRSVRRIIDELKSSAANDKEYLFGKLQAAYLRCAELEEKNFYRKMEEYREVAGLIYDAMADHEVIRELLQQLERLDPDSGRWRTKLELLDETFEAHAEREEHQVFPVAARLLPERALHLMVEQLREEQEEGAQTRRHRHPVGPGRRT
ncbi:hemerythrin domain-containing protein [Geobacter sp. DSM 9736]|uniref:hemerythrin domain-containing protein n=1 Tax=Geobacter sp. DSM 9736 TaxID=1277350 RepID=UPI000B513C2A|nr:hemerythrin domain-containing protein [Geobacter sp. DSM 9736]SNB45256.1 Hemerythrin HHE cation binding domain-containing protein [Geobacter sp. DSM 9736]